MPVPAEDEPDANPGALDAAALDDYLAGFTPEPPPAAAIDDADPDVTGILDTILLLRQAVAAPGAPPQGAALPQSIGRHTILRRAGEGGFSVVWEGFDTLLRRPVAVKVRRPELLLSVDARRRFVREAEIAARLVHPNIVTIYEVGEDAGREFIAAEYCTGGSLAEWLDRHPGPLTPRTAARLVRAVADAVAFAHDAGVVHRDIKPANVLLHPAPPGSEPLLTSARGGDRGLSVKLGDFGLGKVHEEIDGSDPLTQLTHTGSRIGTPAWMAPEQVDPSLGAIGHATDIHALGLLLDRLLTGRPLRRGGTDTEVYRQVLLDEPVPADRVVRGVPRDLAAVAEKCLARRPADRYATAAELAADLDRWLAGRPTLARPLSPLGRTTRLIRRRPVVAALVAVALAAVAAAAWVGLDRGREVARREAELSRQRGLEELRRGFEAVRAGNVAATFQQLEKTRAVDPALADSLAGRWLVRRTHGEQEILFALPDAAPADAKRPRDLYSIVLAPDGRTAAVSGADGSILLLRGLDGRPKAITVAAHDEVNDVAFSPDGTLLASAGQDGRLRWWRVTADGLIAVGEARPAAGPLYAAAWSPDGRTLAVGGEDRVVRLVNLDAAGDARELFRFTPPPGESPEIESLAFVTADTLAASCGDMVMLLDVATGRVLHECERPNPEKRKAIFGSLVVSPDGTRIMACGTDATARVWDVATGQIVTSLPVHPAWVQGCSFAPDGGQIATACRDGGVRVFDAATGRLASRLIGHVGRVWSVAWEPVGTLLTAGADGTVRRFDPRVAAEPALFRERVAPTSLIAAMAELPGTARGKEPTLVVLGAQGVPFRIDPAADVGVPIQLAGEAHVWRQAVAPRTGRLAVTWLEERPVEVVSRAAIERGGAVAADDATVVRLPDGVATAEAVVCWTPEENLLVGTHAGGLFWLPADLRGSRRIAGINGALRLLAAAPTGPPRVVVGGDETVIHPLPRSAGDRSQPTPPVVLSIGEQSSAVAWSPDGALVACGARSGAVHIFEAATGQSLGQLAPHERVVEGLAFSRDGRILVSSDIDRVRISDVATRATLDEVRPAWRVAALLLSADGRRIMIGGPAAGDPSGPASRLAVLELPEPSKRWPEKGDSHHLPVAGRKR